MQSVLEKYWAGVAARLQTEADVFNSIGGHRGEIGRANEMSLANLVTRLLPNTVGIGSGIILDSNGYKSNQTDVIAFDAANQPQLLAQTDQVLFPIETVLMALEVKTTLTTGEINDAGAKCRNLRSLHTTTGISPHFSVFAYQAGTSIPGVARALHALAPDERPDTVCILRPGMFGAADSAGLSFGFVPLHRRGSDGERISNEWETDEDAPQRTGMFPAARIERRGKTKIVTEPGRALLIYCNSLLGALEERNHLKSGWLQPYLPPLAREQLFISSEKDD